MMRRALASVVFLIGLLSSQPLHRVTGIGNGPPEGNSPSVDLKGPMVHLEDGFEGRFGTAAYTQTLNSRLKDWNMDPTPRAYAEHKSVKFVREQVEMVQRQLLQQRKDKNLLFLDLTPDKKRKVHAMFLGGAPEGEYNVAFVSSPKHWRSLNEKMQLHNFAYVEKLDASKFDESLKRDFAANELDALIRNIVPKTPENGLSRMLPVYVHPDYHRSGPAPNPEPMQKLKSVLERPVYVNKARLLLP
ncbi:uncharacterized protein UTRI_06233 [Ustilago trichophora]|uniref:Uncharacterized protein n=1 Tax=Ustilago trichophora TaxID=86804 RepID=A0A5C3EF39_9BASI|nr:uncharacterized protein UTRI_06233 [Ustilago trichophora]